MTTYLGIDVLELSPNTRDELSDAWRRAMHEFDPGFGRREIYACDNAPKVTRTFLWTCRSKAEIAQLRGWLFARKGQAKPFWIPSGRRDFLLASELGASQTNLAIRKIGYGQTAFLHVARQHLAILLRSGSIYRRVLSVTGLESTETLTLSASPGVVVPVGSLICNLLLCRMATDEPEIVHHTDSIAECAIPYVEVPEEAP